MTHRKPSKPSTPFLLFVFLLTVPAVMAQGPGDLTVTPTRVSLEGRTRSAQIALINRADRTTTYRVSFTRMRMSEDGGFVEVTEPEPGERFADPLIRYSPRQVTLEPGESQTVRLLLRKPADLEPGEYRSHLLLHAVPADLGNSIETEAAGVDEGLAVRLVPIYRVAVPVIVRHGDLSAGAELSEVAFEPAEDENGPPALSFQIARRGDRSLYGDVAVSFLSDRGGSPVEVGRLEGLAVYVPNPLRAVTMTLRPPEGTALEAGRLKVVFSEDRESGAVVAEAELPLS